MCQILRASQHACVRAHIQTERDVDFFRNGERDLDIKSQPFFAFEEPCKQSAEPTPDISSSIDGSELSFLDR